MAAGPARPRPDRGGAVRGVGRRHPGAAGLAAGLPAPGHALESERPEGPHVQHPAAARRHCRPSRPPARHQRRRRVDLRDPEGGRRPGGGAPGGVRGPRRLHGERARAGGAAALADVAQVRVPPPPGAAGAGGAGHRTHRRAEAARRVHRVGTQAVLPEQPAGSARARLHGHRSRQGAGGNRAVVQLEDQRQAGHGDGGTRQQARRLRQARRAAARAGRHDRADAGRPAPAHRGTRARERRRRAPGRRRHRHHHGPGHRRGAGAGERSSGGPQPLRRVPSRAVDEPGGAGHLRARVDVQDRHGVGGDGRARVFARGHDRRQRGRLAQRLAPGHRGEEPQLRRPELFRRARQVEQRGRDQDRPRRGRRAPRPVRAPVRVRRALVGRPPGRDARAAGPVGQLEREHAGVGLDGLRDRRDAAPDGGGRVGGGQRRITCAAAAGARAAAGAVAHRGRAARGAPRDHAGNGRRAGGHHGAGRRARHGEVGTDSRIHRRGKDGHRAARS